jgi:hypothetical protein
MKRKARSCGATLLRCEGAGLRRRGPSLQPSDTFLRTWLRGCSAPGAPLQCVPTNVAIHTLRVARSPGIERSEIAPAPAGPEGQRRRALAMATSRRPVTRKRHPFTLPCRLASRPRFGNPFRAQGDETSPVRLRPLAKKCLIIPPSVRSRVREDAGAVHPGDRVPRIPSAATFPRLTAPWMRDSRVLTHAATAPHRTRLPLEGRSCERRYFRTSAPRRVRCVRRGSKPNRSDLRFPISHR